MKTILLKFSGPLQAWGIGSHFETRDTDRYPSKSAVIGLIGASLGISRDDEENIVKLNSLQFAVRIDQPGQIVKDFQIATKYKDLYKEKFDRTYVSNRYYLQDAVFMVAISSDDDSYIEMIDEAIRNPYYATFMGRRSLPVNADFIQGVFDEDGISLLKSYPWQAMDFYKKKGSEPLEVYSDGEMVDSRESFLKQDRVISFSQKRRKHGYRLVKRIEVQLEPNKTVNDDHDIFAEIGE
jgi:CRISPR system Cascade subunit CasD